MSPNKALMVNGLPTSPFQPQVDIPPTLNLQKPTQQRMDQPIPLLMKPLNLVEVRLSLNQPLLTAVELLQSTKL